MDERTWAAALVNLYDYYRVQTFPNKNQEARWFEDVKHIPNHEVDLIISAITHDNDNIPRNIPKAFRDSRAQKGFVEIINYDKDDDIRFPIQLMKQAFRILDEQGFSAYNAYANTVGIPRTDRDRIENKHRVCKANELPNKLPEIGHRVNTWKPRPAIMPLREEGD